MSNPLDQIDLDAAEKLLQQEPQAADNNGKGESQAKKAERKGSRSRSGSGRKKHKKRSRTRSKDRKRSGSRSGSSKRNKKDKKKKKDKKRSGSRSRSRSKRKEEEKKKAEIKMWEKQLDSLRKEEEEAKREDLTCVVHGLPIKAAEKDIYSFFRVANIKIKDIRLVRDNKTNKSKGVAYVEFYNTASMAGAIEMNHKEMEGFKIRVMPSQAEKNRQAAAQKIVRDQQAKVKGPGGQVIPNRIYVGNLTDNLENISEQDLLHLFSPFGEIEFVDIHRDPNTGKCSGYAFIQYKKADDAKAAIKEMNGMDISGKKIKVSQVQSDQQATGEANLDLDEESGAQYLHSGQSRALLMQKLIREPMPAPNMAANFGMMQQNAGLNIMGQMPIAYMGAQQQSQVVPSQMPTTCILLANMVNPAEVNLADDPEFFADLKDEVEEECKKYGVVEKVVVEGSSEGNVWVKFQNMESAMNAQQKLNNRLFAGKKLNCFFVTEAQFYNKWS